MLLLANWLQARIPTNLAIACHTNGERICHFLWWNFWGGESIKRGTWEKIFSLQPLQLCCYTSRNIFRSLSFLLFRGGGGGGGYNPGDNSRLNLLHKSWRKLDEFFQHLSPFFIQRFFVSLWRDEARQGRPAAWLRFQVPPKEGNGIITFPDYVSENFVYFNGSGVAFSDIFISHPLLRIWAIMQELECY